MYIRPWTPPSISIPSLKLLCPIKLLNYTSVSSDTAINYGLKSNLIGLLTLLNYSIQ
ncbi:hypothetical protein BDZ91DRAFT_738614 [Kalaharituber pfeilii]|nr:hypothetical protein BDZ91DRAFT_738614 [Kalaharituber pfeilii]